MQIMPCHCRCEKCGESFVHKKQLTRHVQVVRDRIVYRCPSCDYEARDGYILKTHMAKVSYNYSSVVFAYHCNQDTTFILACKLFDYCYVSNQGVSLIIVALYLCILFIGACLMFITAIEVLIF